MEEEITQQEEPQEEEQSIWELLGIEGEEPYSEAEDEADAEAEKEDKLTKKLASRVDNLEKKFRSDALQRRTQKFIETSDDLERDLFKAIAGDVLRLKDPETLDRAIGLVRDRAAKLREESEKYEEQLKQQAAENARMAWGASPIGSQVVKSENAKKEREEAISMGDSVAAFQAIMEDDPVLGAR